MIKRGLFTTIISLFVVVVSGQTNQPVAMGKWRTHLAYNNVTQITQSANNIFAISDGALFSVNKENTDDMQYFSKMSGLSDANIVRIEYDKVNNQLLIVYNNGNIDIMHSTGVNNIPDLRNKQMSTSKGVNEVFFTGNFAYLSCDFGIMLVNMAKKEITDTYIIGPNSTEVKILSTTIHNNKIYAASATAIYNADADNRNLVNFEYWKTTTGLPIGSGNYQKVFTFAGRLLILKAGKLYKQEDDNSWSQLLSSVNNITSVNVSNNKIIASNGSNSIYFLNQSFEMSAENLLASSDIEYDPANDVYWVAGGALGVVSFKLQSGAAPIISYYKPQGPAVNIPWSMTFAGNKLFMVNGGRWSSEYGRIGQIMIYKDGYWNNISAAPIESVTGNSALDYVNVAVHPDDDNHFFVTSYGTGLYEYKNNEFFAWYNHKTPNSTLETGGTGAREYKVIRLDGAVFDSQKNLFLANMATTSPIKILLNTGAWYQFDFSSLPMLFTLGKIIISNQNQNQKWVPSIRYTPGILIWDDNGTLLDQNDDKKTFISKFIDVDNVGSYISPSYVYCLEQDKNGVMWAGTDLGPLLFYNPSKAFDQGYTCSRVKIPRNDGTGLADYLLQNEKIKAIAIDGANRKWLGTESSGLYLMSENGQETINHFTTSNSPLLSNDIISLAINPVSGELFIGTSNGLISFQSDAAEANKVFTNVYAYPNPVKENYNGIITITGLVTNTQVKITDLNGNLMYQTVSNGSIATWDGKDSHGRKVSTGIYLAICANEDGTQSTITKIMVIN